jgi:hypothetical protein
MLDERLDRSLGRIMARRWSAVCANNDPVTAAALNGLAITHRARVSTVSFS